MLTFFLRVERQAGLGFSWLLKGRRNRKIQSLCVTSLVSDGSSTAENKKVLKGLFWVLREMVPALLLVLN